MQFTETKKLTIMRNAPNVKGEGNALKKFNNALEIYYIKKK